MERLEGTWLPPFVTLPFFLNAAQCRSIIETAEQSPRFRPAELVYDTGARGVVKDHCDFDVLYQWPGDAVYELVRQRLGEQLRFFNGPYQFDLFNQIEEMIAAVAINRYCAETQGHFDPHMDLGGHPEIANRKLTVVTLLSKPDTFEGGDLSIHRGADYKPFTDAKIGTAVSFPSFTMHSVSPVTRGVRYSLVFWLKGPKFK